MTDHNKIRNDVRSRALPARQAARGLARVWLATVLILAGALIAPNAQAQQESPEAVVRAYQETLVSVVQDMDGAGFEAREGRLRPAVERAYDMAYVARRTLGSSNWEGLSEDQRATYIEAYTVYSVATHVSRFGDYGGPGFEIVATQDMPRGYKLVKTELRRNQQEPVSINYLLEERDGRWQIIDVFLRGTISEVATRKAEYTSVMRDQGFDALLTLLRDRTERARNGS